MTDDDRSDNDIVERLPSGEIVPVDELPERGPDKFFLIDTECVDDLVMYAFEFGKQAADGDGASLSDWAPALDLDAHLNDQEIIRETIQRVTDPSTGHDWSEVDAAPRDVRRQAATFAYYLLSQVVIHARITGQVNELDRETLAGLANDIKTPQQAHIYSTVFLAHTHPEFPRETACTNPALYTPMRTGYPYTIDAIVFLWHVSTRIFYLSVMNLVNPETSLTPPWEHHEKITQDKWIESLAHSALSGLVRDGITLPMVFPGDPTGEVTERVAETLPERTPEDYNDLIEWCATHHSLRDRSAFEEKIGLT